MSRNGHWLGVVALAAAWLMPPAAQAQFGMVTLPKDDFTWHWGDAERRRGIEDFSVNGSEAGFRCQLRGGLSPSSRLSPADVRAFENELRMSLFFIQAAAQAMYVLDARREIDWATLDCDKPDREDVSEEERAQRIERARERALREQAQRRERERRQEGRSRN